MANYNSKRTYNKKLTNGGANYNSGPFLILILDSGYGMDEVKNILSSPAIADSAIGQDSIALIASIEVIDEAISIETISASTSIYVQDSALCQDLLSIVSNIDVSDSGAGQDFISTVGAFFVIDSNSILHPLGVLVLRDSRFEPIPSTRDIEEEIPGKHGAFDFGTEFGTRNIELHVATDEGYAPLEKAQLQQIFAKYLDPTKGAKTLIFSDDVEKTYMVKYSGKIDLTMYPTWFDFTLPFKMSDPFIIGSFEKIQVGSGTITNSGTFETPMVIEISGPATNPSLIIGNDTLSYTGTISSGQTLVINTNNGAGTAKIGTTNAMAGYNGVFPMLQPGSTNVTAGSNVIIRWRDKWV